MIVPMLKYTFLIFHREYRSFLKKLQQLGVLHVIEKDVEVSQEIRTKHDQLIQFEKATQFLSKRNPSKNKKEVNLPGNGILEQIKSKQKELDDLQQSLEEVNKDYSKQNLWTSCIEKSCHG